MSRRTSVELMHFSCLKYHCVAICYMSGEWVYTLPFWALISMVPHSIEGNKCFFRLHIFSTFIIPPQFVRVLHIIFIIRSDFWALGPLQLILPENAIPETKFHKISANCTGVFGGNCGDCEETQKIFDFGLTFAARRGKIFRPYSVWILWRFA